MTSFRKDYEKRVKSFHKDFIKDVLDTCIRIHKKDGKAYPWRIFRSVSKRWKHVHRFKITLTLNYFEYLGFLKVRLETVEEFKERVGFNKGLVGKGWRRKYFYPNPGVPSDDFGRITAYSKLTYDDVGKPYVKVEDYPV